NASAAVYSIVQTATLNGLDVYKYLCFLLVRLPLLGKGVSDEALALWGAEARMACRGVFDGYNRTIGTHRAGGQICG
ncbi:MAG: transposase domain-containing protein, partial [Clostridia bacterium]